MDYLKQSSSTSSVATLVELHVENFAIISDLQLGFHPGFNVLTGETGAGKSIVIDAIELLLGGKSSQDMVRAGEQIARVEGIFELDETRSHAISDWLLAHDLNDDPGQIILAREVRRGGRSVARINGRAVAQALLAELGDMLVDIHGQGQHLSLLKPRTHIEFLDDYANLRKQRGELAQLVEELRQVRASLEHLRQNAREIARRIDLLSYQVQEIEEAGLQVGEDEALERERRLLANAETLKQEATALEILLAEGSLESPAALDVLGEATVHLQKLRSLDPDLEPLATQLETLFESLSDLAREIGDYGSALEFDPQRLEEVEERLALISQLKRKYGDDIGEILAFGQEARAELELLANSETRSADLEAREEELLRAIGQKAQELSEARSFAATHLAQAVETELKTLRMADASFQVEILQHPHPQGCYVGEKRFAFDATGIDQVQFLVSANRGEPLRPLAKVASGGETARLMLALKNVLSRADETPILIFDEIDQGIGGRVGAVVGQKLADLACTHQVLCVTHLPQIAAYADLHLQVSKTAHKERTISQITPLSGEERVAELAAMLGAEGESGRQSAQELLQKAQQHSAAFP